MAALEEKLAEGVRQLPILFDKSCRDFKDNSKKRLVWDLERRTSLVQLQTSSSSYENKEQ